MNHVFAFLLLVQVEKFREMQPQHAMVTEESLMIRNDFSTSVASYDDVTCCEFGIDWRPNMCVAEIRCD